MGCCVFVVACSALVCRAQNQLLPVRSHDQALRAPELQSGDVSNNLSVGPVLQGNAEADGSQGCMCQCDYVQRADDVNAGLPAGASLAEWSHALPTDDQQE